MAELKEVKFDVERDSGMGGTEYHVLYPGCEKPTILSVFDFARYLEDAAEGGIRLTRVKNLYDKCVAAKRSSSG